MFLLLFEEPVSLDTGEAETIVIGIFSQEQIRGALDQLFKDRGFVANFKLVCDREIDGKPYRLMGNADVIHLTLNDYRYGGHS